MNSQPKYTYDTSNICMHKSDRLANEIQHLKKKWHTIITHTVIQEAHAIGLKTYHQLIARTRLYNTQILLLCQVTHPFDNLMDVSFCK